jgi:hypothetical protein
MEQAPFHRMFHTFGRTSQDRGISALFERSPHKPVLRYLKVANYPHVNSYPLVSIERVMAAKGLPAVCNPQGSFRILIARILAKLRLPLNLWRASPGPIFVAWMGANEYKTLPLAWWTEFIPYCFDCWEPKWGRWESIFRRLRVRLAFFTARQAASHFAARLPEMTAIWVPEAVDPEDHDGSKPLAERPTGVLELGRKYDRFHYAIREGLEQAHIVHKFERVKGQIIFPSAAEFRRGLGDARISVCFPSSITHPETSGQVETVTLRYFESFASRCIVVGHCPRELRDLFGYNPVVEIEPGRELEQIFSVLDHLEEYRSLIERNYQRLLETSTWDVRISTILNHVNGLFYDYHSPNLRRPPAQASAKGA